ncbi:uncharacterized protein MELLADRAFT_102304 [Melampsora larici-populina 98AG31]|uniref:ABM domain-containing protein n=1 Tax=Melampsora larici-populina (strain 98AG31 / pathotype 3-4-7) TaxID=747676 RepID=F4R7V1_MELLP|nr:uncharacterized protein MELLADRAFT_102304 [Melampsora larici-populina 98AG31]EGG11722.1 hypothetical protein MELLADRAFT_102304 [Melampsora larici-populina 98AG31]
MSSIPPLPSYIKDTKFIILATITVQDDQTDQIKSKLLNIQKKAKSDEEPGTLSYRVHQSFETPNKFTIYEEYENKSGLESHLKSTEFQDLMKLQSSFSLDSTFLQEL